ncbi:MAG: quinolinate synthase NadA [Desulfovibrionaceae bacterium]|nr:quinolinate synthase NadA [Desulfovibrionaceae bacterium]
MSDLNEASSQDFGRAIDALRTELGRDLVIVGHHYQADDIVAHVDHTGDSLELARMIEGIKARHIVFCGVHFMAESARLLAAADQAVYLPVLEARCTMSDTTPAPLLEAMMTRLKSTGRRIVPLAYVNTSLAVKAVVGRHGGAVCTSANAPTMLKWALDQGDAVLFLPDHNLGNNTADQLGLPPERRHILNIRQGGNQVDMEAVGKAALLLWPGCCPIHAVFKPDMADKARRLHPGARVIVHPECTPEMVGAADAAGSTSFIIRQAQAAPEGSTLVVGTEINLVRRLTARHAGRVEVLPLAVSACCSNMTKIRPAALWRTLRAIREGAAQPLQIDQAQAGPAREALTRMLQQCA